MFLLENYNDHKFDIYSFNYSHDSAWVSAFIADHCVLLCA